MILKKIHPVPSGDGERRYRAVWGHRKFSYFFTTDELRELVKQLLDLLKGEPHKEWETPPSSNLDSFDSPADTRP